MGYKNLWALIGVLIMGAGIVIAISGATPTWVSESRWTGGAAGSDVTEGGNITVVNISGTALTDKWASYYGNVTGTIVLGDGSANVYSWAWNQSGGGEICLSTNGSYDFTSLNTATGANVDTVWAFTGTEGDSGANTYKTTDCGLTFSTGTVSNTGNVTLMGSSTFNNCVIRSGTVASGAKGFMAFCTAIQNTTTGRSYNNAPANYEIMVPTATGSGSETYFFFAEFN